MIDFSRSEIAQYFSSRVPSLRQNDTREWRGPCPVHNGSDLNFAVSAETGLSTCHSQCGRGWDILSLEQELSNCDFPTAKREVFKFLNRPEPSWEDRDIEATFDYRDEDGKIRYQVVRKTGKRFMQRRPNGTGWTWGLGDVELLPFRLPEWQDSKFVAVCEGEKDVLALERLGMRATCNNGGAGNFKPAIVRYFSGKQVAIFPDNDEKGREHATKVAELLSGIAASVKIVELPDLPVKGDVSDYIAAGGTLDQIRKLYASAQEWTSEWEFASQIPDENDKYVFTPAQYVQSIGGIDKFWAIDSQTGIPTPWPKLTSDLGGGMRAGEVYVIGANQGAGKTSLALQFGMAAMRKKHGVLMFSLEMGHRDVFQRMASMEARVNLNEYRRLMREDRTSEYCRDMRSALQPPTMEMLNWPLLVSTRSAATPDYLISESTRLKKRQKIGLVIVDHMQLMSATGSVRGEYEKFTAISRACKQVAVELQLPLLLVSQTSRSQSHDKRTELECSDLRGSGAIEEDAAAVMLLYHDAEHSKQTLINGVFETGPVKSWLKIDKNRFGPSGGYVALSHVKIYTRFDKWED